MVFLLSSCADFSSETPPFAITVPTCSTNANFDFTYAGISFYLLNKSHKSISSITAHFMLFDARTQTNPFIGSNIFEIKKFILISPGENKEIILSLDRFIYIAPEEPYLIDFFYISKIEYSDGSIWEDKYGVYGMRQEK
jgi:hypothetical protein